MSRDDLTALGVSLGVHALLLLLFFTVAAESREALEPADVRLVEMDFGTVPIRPVLTGPPQQAEAGERSQAREQPEPERPAPPSASPVRTPERPRTNTPRETPPIARNTPTPDAPVRRPSPPSNTRTPEANPTPPRQPEPTRTTGTGGGESSTDGNAETGTRTGSGGDAPAEVGFNFGNRSFDCPSIPDAPPGVGGRLTFNITFNPQGQFVSARARGRNSALESHIDPYLRRCRAQRLPGAASQVNQTTQATFNVR
ncbi:hypothetical protein [Rubricoccus marinus]|uniref:TonB C-terminal domain-containing protein n=1 Tax=Rubricoccus marinus TaxID=716817 RepID=A0A259TY40_9BACT|nr:hypothetical protein [Rubricoccus marinus]OZC02498.1 hypothetical protein BSZ36_05605 [Rubricoccus marinus]